jgi:hypothetical protein
MRAFDYMGAYIDRRMKHLIEEWNLATWNDLGDLPRRLQALEKDAETCTGFEAAASAKLAELEKRLQQVRELRK